jgi:hypothetical protein
MVQSGDGASAAETAPRRTFCAFAARGGLTPHMIFLRGKVLQAMYKPCYIDAHYAGF